MTTISFRRHIIPEVPVEQRMDFSWSRLAGRRNGQGTVQPVCVQPVPSSTKPMPSLDLTLAQLCFEGPTETLTATENAQPALLTTSIALLAALGWSDQATTTPELPDPAFRRRPLAGRILGACSVPRCEFRDRPTAGATARRADGGSPRRYHGGDHRHGPRSTQCRLRASTIGRSGGRGERKRTGSAGDQRRERCRRTRWRTRESSRSQPSAFRSKYRRPFIPH